MSIEDIASQISCLDTVYIYSLYTHISQKPHGQKIFCTCYMLSIAWFTCDYDAVCYDLVNIVFCG